MTWQHLLDIPMKHVRSYLRNLGSLFLL